MTPIDENEEIDTCVGQPLYRCMFYYAVCRIINLFLVYEEDFEWLKEEITELQDDDDGICDLNEPVDWNDNSDGSADLVFHIPLTDDESYDDDFSEGESF